MSRFFLALATVVLAGAACSTKTDSALPATGSATPAADERIAEVAKSVQALADRVDKLSAKVDKIAAALDTSLPRVQPDEATVYALPIDPRDPIDGPTDARVTIVVAYELLDPMTPRLVALLDAARAGHAADLRVAWRYFAVHGAPAIPAGIVGCAAGRAGVWPAVEAKLLATMYTNGKPSPEKGGLEQLRSLVADAGLTSAKLDAATGECRAWVDAAPATLRAIGVGSPPTLIVNGRVLAGLPTAESLEAAIVAEIAKAAASGIPAASYYEKAIVERGAKALGGRFDE